MSNLNLNLTSEQICQTLSEGYDRLINNYSGPFCTCNDPTSGYSILNANGDLGLTVGNSFFTFSNNDLFFNYCNSDLCFHLYEGANFSIIGCNSCYIFDTNGNLAINSTGIDPNYNGFQITNTNPSIIIKENDSNPDHVIKFLSNNDDDVFHICQSGYDNTFIFSCSKLNIFSNNTQSIISSGEFIGLNSDINTGYNISIGGDSIICGNIEAICNLKLSGLFEISNEFESGSIFNATSFFNKEVILNCHLCVKQGCLYVDTYLSSPIINSDQLYSYNLSISNCAELNNLRVSNNAYLNKINVIDLTSCTIQSNYIDFNEASGNNLNLTGKLSILSDVTFCNNSKTCFYGDSIIFCLTGEQKQFCIKSCCLISDGCIFSNKNYMSSFCATGGETNCVSGTLCTIGDIYSDNLTLSCNLCVLCTCVVNTLSAFTTCVKSIIQDDPSQILCFSSENIKFGDYSPINFTSGIINSKNTAKAWGSFFLSGGLVQSFCGYNFTGVSRPLYLQNSGGTCINGFYGLKFITPIKAPLSTSFTITLDNGYCLCSYSAYPGTNVNHEDLILPQIVQYNCATCSQYPSDYSNYTIICCGCCYYELIIGAMEPIKYANLCFNGWINFTIFGD